MNKHLLTLVSLICSLALLGCSGKASKSDGEETGEGGSSEAGASGTGDTGGTGGSTDGTDNPNAGAGGNGGEDSGDTGGSGGTTAPDEPFYCGDTECSGLDSSSPLSRFNEYCCTPSNKCSTRLTTETNCPDPVTCGGIECPEIPTIPMVGNIFGSACCSPSDKCSFTTPGGTECPEPTESDPDCPGVTGMMGGLGLPMLDQFSALGGDGCCLSGNICGILLMGSCIDLGPFSFFIGGSQVDCDGNPVQPPDQDGGIDAGPDQDSGLDDDDAG